MQDDHLTFLSSPATTGAKVWTPTEVVPYATGPGPFAVCRVPVASLEDAAPYITACPANVFLVRGRPVHDEIIPRRSHRPKPDRPPTLEPEAHFLLPVDIDGKEIPVDGADLPAAAEAARSILPDPLSRSRCLALATSSAGIAPGARVRLWFWLPIALSDDECKAILTGIADTAIYTPSQPIYCAPPIFRGRADPYAGRPRAVWLPGAPAAAPRAPTREEHRPKFSAGMFATPGTEGTRARTLASVAGTMRKRGLEAPAIDAALQEHNRTFPEPLPAEDVAAIAESIAGYEPEVIVRPPADSAAGDRALRRAQKRVAEDPGLLTTEAARLSRHVRSGAISEIQAIGALSRGLDGAGAPAYDRADLAQLLSVTVDDTVPPWAAEAPCDADGNPIMCPESMRLLLTHHPEFSLWFDRRAQRDMWTRCPWREPGELHPSDDANLRAWCSKHLGWHKLQGLTPLEAISAVARRVSRDPWAEYLAGLKWDGTDRLSTAATRLLGCEDTTANNAMFALWMISAAARTADPGCQVDHVLTLKGPQGAGKTSFLRTLAGGPDNFTRLVASSDLTSPRGIGRIYGPVIVEMAELAALKRADIEHMKAFIDERVDRVQWLYAKRPVNLKRMCVFAATTNEDEPLHDVTGGRRWWPIAVGQINLAALAAEREQLWAEAVARYAAGQSWWPTAEQAAAWGLAEQQESFRAPEPCEEALAEVLDLTYTAGRNALTGATITEDQLVDGRLVKVTTQQLTSLAHLRAMDSRAIGKAMTALGWKSLRGTIDGARRRIWVRTVSTEEMRRAQ